MPKVFFTYVWGDPGNPAWPLTFSSKTARAHAKLALTEGDFVFTVGTKGEPTEKKHQGRVLGVYQVSDLEVNTQDYKGLRPERPADADGFKRFPFALHPLAVWEITSRDNVFAQLVGPLTPNHHLQAQSKVVELDPVTAEPLLALEKREVAPAVPNSLFGQGLVAQKNSKLAPKHKGTFEGSFGQHAIWFVYVLVLRNAQQKDLAFKIGYSHNPVLRAVSYNRSVASEVTGLTWSVYLTQPTPSEDAARHIEQALLGRFAGKCLATNGEIVGNVAKASLDAALADIMRSSSVLA